MSKLYHIYPSANIWATGYTTMFPNGKEGKTISVVDGWYTSEEYIEHILSGIHIAWTSSIMARKQVLHDLGGFPVGYNNGEDVAVWLSLVLRANGIAVSHEVTATYQKTHDGLTSRLVTSEDPCMLSIAEHHLQSMRGCPRLLILLNELYNYYALAHAINAMLHGEKKIALYFLSLSKKTTRFRMKYKILRCLLVCEDELLSFISKFIFIRLLPFLRGFSHKMTKQFL
jgi:hypothetical protein